MINNRQGGRRRGRGGQRGPTGTSGNRQDNRQRGNAAQLLEKYKSMARDAQLSGDRVQTEYYLQFADHYFRVLSENRPKDDNRRSRDFDDDGDDEDLDGIDGGEGEEQAPQQARRDTRRERPRRDRDQDRDQDRNQARDGNRDQQRDQDVGGDDGEDEPRARRAPRKPRDNGDRPARASANANGGTLSLDALPPAIGGDGDEVSEEAPRPRRKRTPRATDGDEASAA